MEKHELQLVKFSGVFDKEPKPVTASWDDFVRALSVHKERGHKEGRLWSPVQYLPDSKRVKDGVDFVTMAVCDGDQGVSPDPIEQQLRDAGLAHVVHSTYSHTAAHPKWRIIVPLKPVVKGEDWPEIWPVLTSHLFGDAADQAASDASRMFYTPSCPPGATRFARHYDGDAFDVANLPSPEPKLDQQIDTGPSVFTSGDGVLERALKAKNGDKFKRLWDGDDSDYQGDTSKGDIALCNQLAFWTRCDPSQMDRVFRMSQRMRPKWDERHYATGETYGQRTIDKAIANCTDVYEPNAAPIIMGSAAAPVVAAADDDEWHLTDLGNANRFSDEHSRSVRFCAPLNSWFVWSGKNWEHDDVGEVMQRAKQTTRGMYKEAINADDLRRQALVKHALRSESERSLKAMVSLARSDARIRIKPDSLDRNGWLLNLENGTLDLRTGALDQHRSADLITRLLPITYDPTAACPKFAAFLDQIFAGNEELIAYVQRAFGYSLTGDLSEQILLFFYGSGFNGKSTLLNLWLELLGPYAKQADPELLLARRGDVHPTNVADL